MKYSFMSFSCPELTLKEALEKAQNLGYSGFDPRTDSKHAHGIELNMTDSEIKNTLSVLGDYNVKLSCLATSIKIAGRAERNKNLEDAKKAIDVCLKLGIPNIRIFGGPIDEDDTRENAIEEMARAFESLDPAIGDENLNLCIETHDKWTDPKNLAAVMKLSTSKHSAINWDVMHTLLASNVSPKDTVALIGPYIRYVHMHDGTYTPRCSFKHFGTGEIDHREIMKELVNLGYNGYMSGEWIGWNEPDYLRKEIEEIRKIEAEVLCTK